MIAPNKIKDTDTPVKQMLPITGPVIQSGQSLSDPLNLTGTLESIGMPPDWTNAILTFQISPDAGVTWFDLMKTDGSEVMMNIIPGTMVPVDVTNPLTNKSWVKFRSGTRDFPVKQKATRTFTLAVV